MSELMGQRSRGVDAVAADIMAADAAVPRGPLPRMARRSAGVTTVGALAVLAIGGVARVAHPCCNLVPGTVKTFNTGLGAANRPFAAPGETLEILTRPCDVGTPGIMPLATDHVVTVVFTPP